ncbi:hypothetical protein EMCRGX_G002867 [Ephydatia muelleri]
MTLPHDIHTNVCLAFNSFNFHFHYIINFPVLSTSLLFPSPSPFPSPPPLPLQMRQAMTRPYAPMGTFVWWEELQRWRAEWNSVSMASGGRCVAIPGPSLMPRWYASSLAWGPEVTFPLYHYYIIPGREMKDETLHSLLHHSCVNLLMCNHVGVWLRASCMCSCAFYASNPLILTSCAGRF